MDALWALVPSLWALRRPPVLSYCSFLCVVTTFSTASRARPPGAPGRPALAEFGRGNARRPWMRELVRELCQSQTGGRAPRRLRAGGMPSPDGREPSGLGAATRSAGPHPQAGSSRSNAPTVTATARTDRAVLLAPGILSPRKDHTQERSLRSRPSDGASRRSGL
jgi:hypothetical protein